MIDLHTHTLFSDGELLPAELIRRAEVIGLQGIALTDHVDQSNLDMVLSRLLPAVNTLNQHHDIQALVGVELTHLPPELIRPMCDEARAKGAQVVVVHGETLVEPVAPGTNLAALEAGADILAHPGLLTPEQARMAASKGVLLELSARKGHCLANGLVAKLAMEAGARLIINTDAHSPADLINQAQAEKVALGAGVPFEMLAELLQNARELWVRARGLTV